MKHFSPDYATARARFRDAVARYGGQLTALTIAAKGPAGEDLTIDIGWLGAEEPQRILVHSCGLHGVEGFAGSAIQLQWLDEAMPAPAPDAAVVLIHVANPHGMAWRRRVNAHSVDLNRNCLPQGEPYGGAPDGYDALDGFLNPPSPPSAELFHLRAAWLILKLGMPALKQTIAGGQYVNPKGLFYGGRTLEEEPSLLMRFVRERFSSATRLVSVDVHTGLGLFGVDTLLTTAEPGSEEFAALRASFGDRVSPLDPDRGPAYRVKGTYDTVFRTLLPDTRLFLIGQEFGTYSPLRMLRTMRAENRSYHHGSLRSRDRAARALMGVFAPEDERWRGAVLVRGRTVMRQALELLARTDAVGPTT